MGRRSRRRRWRQRYASKLNIAGDGGVDAAGNGYGAPFMTFTFYVNKIFDVNYYYERSMRKRHLIHCEHISMLMLVLHWSWLRVVSVYSLNLFIPWILRRGGLWCCTLDPGLNDTITIFFPGGGMGGGGGGRLWLKSFLNPLSHVCLKRHASWFLPQSFRMSLTTRSTALSTGIWSHFPPNHYNIEQVHLKVSFSKNYYEVLVFPNYCKRDTHCGTRNLPSLTV